MPDGGKLHDHRLRQAIVSILERRDAVPADLDAWLNPDLLAACTEPERVPRLAVAAEWLLDGVLAGTDTIVFGDYDADGICSVTAICRLFEALGAPPRRALLPDRIADGHGLSANAVEALLAARPDLLVVVDCGTTSAAALTSLAEVIGRIVVIDHHGAQGAELPVLPDNVVLVNPAIDPDPAIRAEWGIASAGVLSYLTILHTARLRRQAPLRPGETAPAVEAAIRSLMRDCLGLASITAITDVVPLLGLNRAIVRRGLRHAARLPGIQALARAFPRPLDPDSISAEDVGFRYGPVINAAGRIAHGEIALTLLRAAPGTELSPLAAHAVSLNQERRDIQNDVIDRCLETIEALLSTPDAPAGDEAGSGTLVRDPTFHPGVVGLAASRLVERTGRPAIVIGAGGAGSCRSVPGFNVGDFIREQVAAGRLGKGGGHAAAAGFTLTQPHDPESHLAFADEFVAASRGIRRVEPQDDLILNGADMMADGFDFAGLYETMAPFGAANPALQIRILMPQLRRQKWFGRDRNHWKCGIGNGRFDLFEAAAFNLDQDGPAVLCAAQASERRFPSGAIAAIIGKLRGGYDNYLGRVNYTLAITDFILAEDGAAADA